MRRAEHRIARRTNAPVIDNALQLPHVRQPPVVVAGEAQVLTVGQGFAPRHVVVFGGDLSIPVKIWHVLLPHEPRAFVRHCAVAVVYETQSGFRRPRTPARQKARSSTRTPRRPVAQGSRGRRSKMTVSATELAEMRKTMTGKAIAQKLGVSIGTVTNHLKKHGLTGKRGRPAKK